MKVGKICKGTSVVFFILNFIGSILLAAVGPYFNWGLFLGSQIAGFIFCLTIFALGEIIDLLEYSNGYIYKLSQLLEKTIREEEKKSESSKSHLSSSAPVVHYDPNGWVCKKCDTKNDPLARFCKNCGTYK